VLQPQYHAVQEMRRQARHTTILSCLKRKSEETLIDPRAEDDNPVGPDDPQSGQSSRQ
jgi:hypothetical protein